MRKEKRLLQGLVTAVAVAIPTGTQAQQRPNIILFMVDDMGWQDTSVAFWNRRTPLNDTYETPNMERLAREGMLFSQAYAAPISSPSRCSLMTGANAARHRVTNWTLRRDESTDIDDPVVRTPEWNYNGITQQTITTQTITTPNSHHPPPMCSVPERS